MSDHAETQPKPTKDPARPAEATAKPDEAAVRAGLVAFVCQNFAVTEAEFDKGRSLIDQGVIDSFGLVEITTFIEQRFGVTVEEEDMTREKFGSLDKMARFVAARLAGRP